MIKIKSTRGLWLYFILAVGLAWLVWVPAAMATYGLPGYQLPLLGLVGTMGPGIATFIAAGVLEGRDGIRDLVRRIGICAVGAPPVPGTRTSKLSNSNTPESPAFSNSTTGPATPWVSVSSMTWNTN